MPLLGYGSWQVSLIAYPLLQLTYFEQIFSNRYLQSRRSTTSARTSFKSKLLLTNSVMIVVLYELELIAVTLSRNKSAMHAGMKLCLLHFP